MKAKTKSGYSTDLANVYVPEGTDIISISDELTTKVKWVDGHPTDEVTGYTLLFAIPNNFFTVKFDKEVKAPAFKANVKFTGLEACEVNGNIYFRAKDVKEV